MKIYRFTPSLLGRIAFSRRVGRGADAPSTAPNAPADRRKAWPRPDLGNTRAAAPRPPSAKRRNGVNVRPGAFDQDIDCHDSNAACVRPLAAGIMAPLVAAPRQSAAHADRASLCIHDLRFDGFDIVTLSNPFYRSYKDPSVGYSEALSEVSRLCSVNEAPDRTHTDDLRPQVLAH